MTGRRFTLDAKPPADDVYSAEDAFRPRPPVADDDDREGEEDEP